MDCCHLSLDRTNRFASHALPARRRGPLLGTFQTIALLMLVNAASNVLIAAAPGSAPGLALARYIASAEKPSPFNQPGTAAIEIQAALPDLYKQCRLLVVRTTIDSAHSQYLLLGFEGDIFVAKKIVAPYFDLQDQIEGLTSSSIAITPANYRFRHIRLDEDGPVPAYVFRITPKKKRLGLIDGELWIDAASGASILQAGQLAKTPPGQAGRPRIVRDIKLVDGIPLIRITHVTMKTKDIGRGELTITESRVVEVEIAPPLPAPQGNLLGQRF